MGLLASIFDNKLWHLVPLVVAISLVYGATRHEEMKPILVQAYRTGVWLVTFLAIIFAIFAVLSWSL
jgi:hypothetical protein